MEDRELERLLVDLESDRVERKESLSDTKKIRQAICAFANDLPNHRAPGVLFIGARDDGSCAGLEISDDLLRRLADLRDDGRILPLPSMRVEKRRVADCDLAVVIVEPSLAPPVRFEGRIWIRVGPRRAIASAEEERRLSERRRSRDLPFDLQPLPSVTLEDLDLDLFERVYLPAAVASDVLAANERSLVERLRALRFVDSEELPTVLGVLVLAKDVRAHLPGAYVQFIRFAGTGLADPIRDEKIIGGPLSEMLKRLDDVLEVHVETAVDLVSSPTEIRRPDYPLAALQQLARNAILHRNYESTSAPIRISWFDDRIEIHSPGGPFGQVTPETFGQPGLTDYRNPHLAEAMRNLGYVQRFGVGIAVARRALEENENPPLDFEVQPAFVLATLGRRT